MPKEKQGVQTAKEKIWWVAVARPGVKPWSAMTIAYRVPKRGGLEPLSLDDKDVLRLGKVREDEDRMVSARVFFNQFADPEEDPPRELVKVTVGKVLARLPLPKTPKVSAALCRRLIAEYEQSLTAKGTAD